jgi:hypothetical protein
MLLPEPLADVRVREQAEQEDALERLEWEDGGGS